MFDYKPTIYVKRVQDIDYSKLKKNGIKLICFDLDNTLDEPDRITKTPRKEVADLIENLNVYKFQIMIVSNNSIEGRVESFTHHFDLPYIENMHKPFQRKYNNKIINKYKKEEILFVGDKLSTDIIGAHWFGSPSALVDPLCPDKRHWYTNIMFVADLVWKKIIRFETGVYYDNY